jgi:CheY-specific phosphatase CheX
MNSRSDPGDLPSEVIEAFTSSAVTAVHEMTQLEAIPVAAPPGQPYPGDSLVATMQLKRPIPGALTLVLPPDTSRRLAESYLPAGTALTDEIMSDFAGELANVIAGQAKTILKDTPFHFALSIPTVARLEHRQEIRGDSLTIAVDAELFRLCIDLTNRPVL